MTDAARAVAGRRRELAAQSGDPIAVVDVSRCDGSTCAALDLVGAAGRDRPVGLGRSTRRRPATGPTRSGWRRCTCRTSSPTSSAATVRRHVPYRAPLAQLQAEGNPLVRSPYGRADARDGRGPVDRGRGNIDRAVRRVAQGRDQRRRSPIAQPSNWRYSAGGAGSPRSSPGGGVSSPTTPANTSFTAEPSTFALARPAISTGHGRGCSTTRAGPASRRCPTMQAGHLRIAMWSEVAVRVGDRDAALALHRARLRVRRPRRRDGRDRSRPGVALARAARDAARTAGRRRSGRFVASIAKAHEVISPVWVARLSASTGRRRCWTGPRPSMPRDLVDHADATIGALTLPTLRRQSHSSPRCSPVESKTSTSSNLAPGCAARSSTVGRYGPLGVPVWSAAMLSGATRAFDCPGANSAVYRWGAS